MKVLVKVLVKSIKHWGKAYVAIKDQERILNDLRRQYWGAYDKSSYSYIWQENQSVSQEISEAYYEKLLAKDFYYIYLGFMDYINPNTGKSSLKGWGDALNLITTLGEKFDGGINDTAQDEFEVLTILISRFYWSNVKMTNLLWDTETYEKALIENEKYFVEYFKKRNKAEFLFKNPYSPLKSQNEIEYYLGIAFANNLYSDFEDANKDLNYLYQLGFKKQIIEGIANFKEIAPSLLVGPEIERLLNWHIGKTDKKLLTLYCIKRQFLVSWKKADLILNNRIKRYGAVKISEATSKIWEERNDSNSMFPSNPLFVANKKTSLKTVYSANMDCMPLILGKNTLWNDLIDLAKSEMNLDEVRLQFKNILKKEKSNEGVEERYLRITQMLNEELLLSAFYIGKTYGSNLYTSQKGGNTSNLQELESDFKLGIGLNILQGMAIAKKDYIAIVISSEEDLNAMESSIQNYLKLGKANFDENLLMKAKQIDFIYKKSIGCSLHPQNFIHKKICGFKTTKGVKNSISSKANIEYNPVASSYEYYETYNTSQLDTSLVLPGCENAQKNNINDECFPKKMKEHIQRNFNYPIEAKNKGLIGEVYISFIVELDGSIYIENVKGEHKILRDEFKRIIKTLPKINPGKRFGQEVRVELGLTIYFKNDNTNVFVDGKNNVNYLINYIDESPVIKGCEDSRNKFLCLKTELTNYILNNFKCPKSIGLNDSPRGSRRLTISFDGNVALKKGSTREFRYGEPKLIQQQLELIKEFNRIFGLIPKVKPGKLNKQVVNVDITLGWLILRRNLSYLELFIK